MQQRTLLGAIAAALTVATLSPAPATAADTAPGHVASAYALELLEPTSDGVTSSALGINDAGDVVGITRPTASARPQSTVLWERHGDHFHAHELSNLAESSFSRGFDLNDSRSIVGEAFNAAGISIPIRWQGDSAPVHVTNLTEAGSGILNDINDAGVAVGTAGGKAVSMSDDGAVSVLTAPRPDVDGATVNNYSASAISPEGVVGGRVSLKVPHDDHFHTELFGVVWRHGAPSLLGLPDEASTPTVAGVSTEGEPIGSVTVASKETAAVWNEAGTLETLPLPGIADYTHTAAKAGHHGVYVGYTSKFAGNTSFGGAAIAWDAHGPVDLNTRVTGLPSGVTLQSANDINESGQIVGTATTADGSRGFVLTPKSQDLDPQPVATTLQASAVSQRYGTAARLVMQVSPATATGKVTARVGRKTISGTVVSGRATLTVPAQALVPGRHAVSVTYAGIPGRYTASSTTARVTVAKATPRLKVAKNAVSRGKVATFSVRVTALGIVPTGRVTVNVAGKTRAVRLDRDGRAKLKIRIAKRAKAGVRSVAIIYSGDRFVTKRVVKVSLRVKR